MTEQEWHAGPIFQFQYCSIPFYIYESHGQALLCWQREFERNNCTPLFLVTIDAHIDVDQTGDVYTQVSNLIQRSQTSPVSSMRNTILNLLNEFGPSFNSLFLQAARELGIISDAIIASPGENDRSDERQQYIQGNLNWHHQDSFSGLFSSHEGLLNDRRNGECQCVQEEIYATSVIFDIDLDYFTYSWEGRRYPVPNQIISRILAENQPMREIRNIYAVTIALEPNYCGGLAHSQEILQAVLFSLTGLSNSIDVRHLCPNSINANYIEGHFDDD